MTEERAASALGLKPAYGLTGAERLRAIERGEVQPTRPVLLKMSKKYGRPLVAFYLTEPPRVGDRGEDFRLLPDTQGVDEFRLEALMRNVRARQGMVRAILEDEAEEPQPLDYVGSITMARGYAAAAEAIVERLELDIRTFWRQRSTEPAFDVVRSAAEEAGVFVLLASDLGSHHSRIEPETFRGFTLADDLAPFIVVNDQDSQSAWSFTVLHELTHLFLGQSGVGGQDPSIEVEGFCNDVAAEILLPRGPFNDLEVSESMPAREAVDRIAQFASSYNVSGSMVAYALYRQGRISRDGWLAIRDEFKRLWQGNVEQRRQQSRASESGPSYYVVRRHRVGKPLLELVSRTLADGAISTVKAGTVLGVKPTNVGSLIGTG